MRRIISFDVISYDGMDLAFLNSKARSRVFLSDRLNIYKLSTTVH